MTILTRSSLFVDKKVYIVLRDKINMSNTNNKNMSNTNNKKNQSDFAQIPLKNLEMVKKKLDASFGR